MERSFAVGSRRLPSKTRSKKRTLEETVTEIDLEKDVVELSPEEFNFEGRKKVKVMANAKGKQVMIQDVIDLDCDGYLPDAANKLKLGGKYEGKDLIILSDGDECDKKKTRVFKKPRSSHMSVGGDGFANESSSFVAASTELSGRTETPPANNLHEDAIKRIQQLENFAIVDDFSDHHYAKDLVSTQPPKVWAKKIQDEWKILQSSLPETIFVRACESKMSLLRVVIIGPQGTPYHDGLFFFDMMFPSTYPREPPQVYYHSGGLQLNPNLYNTGKVCLSLLGTWTGRSAAEHWIPGKSTMLQVLVSIQALILNEKPYFNEPGCESSMCSEKGEKASKKYNEDTLIESLKTMLYSMRRSPKHFEGFVSDYFITRSRAILLACKAYMDGAQVGSVSIVEGKAVERNGNACCPSFKNKIRMLMNPLIDEFAKLGVKNCDEFRTNVMSAKPQIFKVKPKKSSANKLTPIQPALTVAYPLQPPPIAWNPSTTGWISPSAVHASSTAMLSLARPVMPNFPQNNLAGPHTYSKQIRSSVNVNGMCTNDQVSDADAA